MEPTPQIAEGTALATVTSNEGTAALDAGGDALLAAIVESSQDAIVSKDLNGIIRSWNKGAERMFGYGAEEVIGRPVSILADPVRHNEFPEILSRIRRGEKVDHYETVRRRKDGRLIDVALTVSPVRNRAGEIVGASKILRDVTERKRMEAAVHEQNRVLEMIARGRPLDEVLTVVCLAVERQFPGSTCSILLLRPETGRLHPGAGPHLPDWYQGLTKEGIAVGASGGPWGAAVFRREAVILPDISADPLWVDWHEVSADPWFRACWSRPIFSDKSEVLGAFTIFCPERRGPKPEETDALHSWIHLSSIATLRQRGETALRQSEDHYRQTVELNPQVPWTATADGQLEDVSPQWLSLTGLTREQALTAGWTGVPHPDDMPRMTEAWMRSMQTGEPLDVEHRIRAADGSYRWMRTRARPRRDTAGKIIRWYGYTENIDEHKRAAVALQAAHQEFNAVIAASPLPIVALTRQGAITLWNPAAELVFGWCAEEVMGRPLPFIPEDKNEEHLAMRARDLVGQGFTNREITRRRKNGALIDLSVSTAPFRDTSGEVTGIMSVYLDITDRKRAEAAHQALERQLLLMVEASGSLLASAHSPEVLRSIVELARRFVSADAYSVWRKSEHGVWVLSSSEGLSEEYVRSGIYNSASESKLLRNAVMIDDVAQDPRLHQRQESLIREGVRSMLLVPLRIDGAATGTVVFYWRSKRQLTEPEMRIASALGNLAASALGTADLYNRQRKQRELAEASERRAAFLAEAGAVLASSLDYEVTLASVAQLAVSKFADWAAVDLLDEHDDVRRVAVTHTDPEKVRFAYEFNERYPPRHGDPGNVALRTGKSVLVEEIPDELIDSGARDPEHAQLIRQLGLRSFMIVPMVLGRRSLGIITFATAESGRQYGPMDLQMAEELARRAASAIENAGLYRDVRISEERYRSLVSATTSIVWTVDPQGRFTDRQSSWEAYTGQSRAEHDGFGWASAIHPDDRTALQARWVECRDAEKAYEAEGRLWHAASAEYRHFVARAAPVRNADGTVREWVGTVTDVHERRMAEEERASLLIREKKARQTAELLNRVGPILSAELNQERLIQSVTDLATKLAGAQVGALFYYRKEEGGQPVLLHALSGAPRAAVEALLMLRNAPVPGAIESRKVVRLDDIGPAPEQDGLPVRSYLAVPVISRSTEVLGALVFGHGQVAAFDDEHEQIVIGIAAQAAIALDNARLFAQSQQAQHTLERTNQELRRANADLEQFAYTASHDLQEPLRMVAVYSQMVQRIYSGRLDSKADEYLGYAVEGAHRMGALVRDLLTFTQAASIAEVEVIFPVNAEEALDEALSNLTAILEGNDAIIHREKLPVLMVKKVHLLQLFQNLIGNAIKYRGTQPPDITVTAMRDAPMWMMCVSDNGIGIAPEYKEQVFGIFKRLHGRSQYEGTGIGLAICQKIVHRYGGRIWVKSLGEGRGATFCFTLPGAGSV
jgi:PAS domain S-box-containing protein